MATEVIMPKSGMTMEEGTVINWLISEGDKTQKGEPLLNIETDKVNMEIESPADGILLKIIHGEGETVPIATIIGYIGKEGEALPDRSDTVIVNSVEPKEQSNTEAIKQNDFLISKTDKIPATPAAKTFAKSAGIDISQVIPSGHRGEVRLCDVKKAATPLAKKIAENNGISLDRIKGSGINGKITADDVRDKLKNADLGSLMSPLRFSIAKQTLLAHKEIPPVTLQMDAEVTSLVEMRQKAKEHGRDITYNDLAVMAAAKALTSHMNINATVDENKIIYHSDINIGVALEIEGGLIVPVVKNADKLSIGELSSSLRALYKSAREGTLDARDINGSTFTVSNLGMFDVKYFTPIINVPNGAILGICSIRDEVKLIDGVVAVKKVMGLCLTFDHRLTDGASAARLLQDIKGYLESPLELFL